jgi:hypothetical protein
MVVLEQQMMSGPKFVRFFSPMLEALKELGGSGRENPLLLDGLEAHPTK